METVLTCKILAKALLHFMPNRRAILVIVDGTEYLVGKTRDNKVEILERPSEVSKDDFHIHLGEGSIFDFNPKNGG